MRRRNRGGARERQPQVGGQGWPLSGRALTDTHNVQLCTVMPKHGLRNTAVVSGGTACGAGNVGFGGLALRLELMTRPRLGSMTLYSMPGFLNALT